MEKIILHAHSCWSHDSLITLKDWRSLMIAKGISKLYLTEHEESGWNEQRFQEYITECKNLSCSQYEIVPGLELNIRGYHVLAPALENYRNRPNDLNLVALKSWVEKRGSFLIAAHPDKYNSFDKELLAICTGIEIVNTKHQYNWLIAYPRYRTYRLMKEFSLRPFIGQDIHRLTQFCGKGLLFNNTDNLLDAYSSTYQRKPNLISESLILTKNLLLKMYIKLKNIC